MCALHQVLMHLTYAADQLDYRSGLRVSPTASSSSSGLPISGERHITSATRSVPISSTAKRPRLGIDDHSHLAQSAPATLAPNSNSNPNHVGGSPTFPFRLDVDLPASYQIPSLSSLHSPHPSLTALYPSSSSMPSIMSSSSSFLTSPFGQSTQAPTLRAVTFPHGGGGSHSHSQSPYSPHGHPSSSIFARNSHHGQSSASADRLFADLLGSTGEHGNGGGAHGGGGAQFPSFDWPVHSTQASQQGTQGQHENGTSRLPPRPPARARCATALSPLRCFFRSDGMLACFGRSLSLSVASGHVPSRRTL